MLIKISKVRISLKILFLFLVTILVFSIETLANQSMQNFSNNNSDGNKSNIKAQCYWQEKISGNQEWIPLSAISGNLINKKNCMKLDSCYGGFGAGGGDCYKWAKSASEAHLGWDKENSEHYGLLDPIEE